jgi:hypothetical protein
VPVSVQWRGHTHQVGDEVDNSALASGPPPLREPPFGTKPQLSRALLQLHCRLRGELAKARSGEDLLRPVPEVECDMLHVEALMPLLGVDFEPESLRPIEHDHES